MPSAGEREKNEAPFYVYFFSNTPETLAFSAESVNSDLVACLNEDEMVIYTLFLLFSGFFSFERNFFENLKSRLSDTR